MYFFKGFQKELFPLLYVIFNFLACYQRHAHGEAKGAVALPCSSQLPSLHKLEGPTVNFILPSSLWRDLCVPLLVIMRLNYIMTVLLQYSFNLYHEKVRLKKWNELKESIAGSCSITSLLFITL